MQIAPLLFTIKKTWIQHILDISFRGLEMELGKTVKANPCLRYSHTRAHASFGFERKSRGRGWLFLRSSSIRTPMLIQGKLERTESLLIMHFQWEVSLEHMETNLIHFKWGSVFIVTSYFLITTKIHINKKVLSRALN